MKKMIPIYVMQLLMLLVVTYAALQITRDVALIRETTTPLSSRTPRDAFGIRVIVTNVPLETR